MIVSYEGTDALDEVTELDVDVPQEGAACPLYHDRDCFRVQFGQIEFNVKPRPNVVGAYLSV